VVRVAAVVGVVAAVLWLITARGCRVRRPLPTERQSLPTLLKALATNHRQHFANLLTYLNFTVFCAQGGLAIHYTRFILHRPASDASFLLTCTTIAAFVGVALVPLPVRRFGVRRTYLGLLMWEAISLLLMLAAGTSFPLFLLAAATHSIANGPVSPLCLSILSESVDNHRHQTGVAAAGLAFATNTLVGKMSAGVTGFLIATFLAFGDYSPMLHSAGEKLSWWLTAGFIGLPLCAVAIAFIFVFCSHKDEGQSAPTVVAPLA
jgi:GPH family glycoside/pentoside/hexuronide:cation symporter